MRHLTYKANAKKNRDELFVEEVAISDVAESVGTPFYCYSKKTLIENFTNFTFAFASAGIVDYKICYAVKANFNLHLVKILSELGAGIDAVSAGEIHRALQAKIDPKKIVFAGVGKQRSEIEFALKSGVEEFSVESEPEMFLLNQVAVELQKKAKFLLRVNPDVDAKTHDKISTGRKGDKFGVDIDLAEGIYAKAAKLPGLEVRGISTHIGSQITKLEPFEMAFSKMRQLCLKLRKNGHQISILDFGGGIGISYRDENPLLIADYARLIKKMTADLGVKITIAPGRAIVGNAGILVTKVIFIKETRQKNFAIIDAAMNDLMRPGLYSAYHETLPVNKKNGRKSLFSLAGPVCETTDILANDRQLIDPASDDLLVLCSAGAYGSSMANEYNCRPLIPEVLVDGKNFRIIRRRPSFEEMAALEMI